MPENFEQDWSIDAFLSKMDLSNRPEAYLYAFDTGVYIGHAPCEIDPLESVAQGKPVWLIPADSTFEKPPKWEEAWGDKKVIAWKDNKWQILEDNRNIDYWLPGDDEMTPARRMESFGSLPEGATTIPPAHVPTEDELFSFLRSAREQKLGEYDAARNQLERKQRLTKDATYRSQIDSRLAKWDEYAEALCNITGQEGAPWDGGGPKTPWPKAPFLG